MSIENHCDCFASTLYLKVSYNDNLLHYILHFYLNRFRTKNRTAPKLIQLDKAFIQFYNGI